MKISMTPSIQYTSRKTIVYCVTDTELELLKTLPWWKRKKLIQRILMQSVITDNSQTP